VRRKGWIGIVGVVILAILAVTNAGCFGEHSDNTVQIGIILPLTGGAANVGKAGLNGIQLAVDDFNAQIRTGEKKIDLIVEDDEAEPAAGVSAFEKLVAAHSIRLILGPVPSGVVLAVAPLAERSHVVIFSPGASAPAITQAGDYIFRNELSEEYGARAQADLAFSRLGFRSAALLYVNNEYGVGTVQVFRDRFAELGGRIVTDEAFSAGTTDFRTALTKIKSAKPDVILVVFQDDIVNVLRQRAQLDVSIPVFTTPVFEDPANLRKLGRLAEGILYTYYGSFDPEAHSGVTADFVNSYELHFGEPPTYYAALAYDAARILTSALVASQFDVDKVKDSLYGIQDFQGVTGATSFDRNGDVSKPITLKTVRGGRFVAY
jgi:branched-chain amino acid transport system substrate-binding protein